MEKGSCSRLEAVRLLGLYALAVQGDMDSASKDKAMLKTRIGDGDLVS
jgi:hypothetical protein